MAASVNESAKLHQAYGRQRKARRRAKLMNYVTVQEESEMAVDMEPITLFD